MRLSRRRWLGAVAAAGMGRAAGAPKRGMIVRSARPEDLEMPLDGFATWITPVEKFFVRSHLYTPVVDSGAWRLHVEGEVEKPLALDLAELRRMPRAELVSVLECAGNGRSFYRPAVIGMPWQHGAVGNARWSGVRLNEVLKRAGLKAAAKHVALNGADVPLGAMPDFIRSIPLQKALDPDTLLAYEMNGEPLAPEHGFPLRLVAPGWAGDAWVKWLTNLQARADEYDGFWMKTAYRYPARPVGPGSAVDAADMQPVTHLRVKSVIAWPGDGQRLAPGAITARGAAWSGGSPIAHVDFSADSGRTWQAARLSPARPEAARPEAARYGWRLWEATWTPPGRGSYLLMARATDASGATQPLVADWNPSGYLWNAVHQVRVEIGAAQSALPAAGEQRPAPELPAEFRAACTGCHGEDMIAGQRLTRAQWERELDKMARWGATVRPEERPALLDFLVRHFGPQ